MRIDLFSILLAMVFTVSCSEVYSVESVFSPSKSLNVQVYSKKDTLFFQLNQGHKELTNLSPLILCYNDEPVIWEIKSSSVRSIKDDFRMMTGEFDRISHNSVQADICLLGKTEGGSVLDAVLQLRVFNQALSYRLILNQYGKSYTVEEKSELRLKGNALRLFMPNGEKEPIGNVAFDDVDGKIVTTPIIACDTDKCVSIHEANLHNYPMMNIRFVKERSALELVSGKAFLEGVFELPWRVIFYGDDMSELHSLKTIYMTLNEPCDGDFSWVKPGIALWDWRVKGAVFNRFRYGMNDLSLKRYIDFAAQSGIRYFLLDDEWYKMNPLKSVSGLDIQNIINYSNSKGVGMLLYYDLRYVSEDNPEIDFEKVAQVYSSWGAKGVKYGFLGKKGTKFSPQEKTNRTEELIRIAAKNRLLIDFHDGPIPYSGLERTYPNYINREYCHAQLDCRLAFPPREFVKIACVNMLAGQIDQTNGTYAINEMKMRSKGPRNEYNSTVASETARVFITHTGHLSVLIDAPEAYSEKMDLFSFIASLPSHWDETRYLKMDFNSHVSVARRSEDIWYVGTVYNEKGGVDILNLDFLDNEKYEMILFSDSEKTHYINNKEDYKITKRTVIRNDRISIYVAPGGGYSALIKKIGDLKG